jgi:hypothetical protein
MGYFTWNNRGFRERKFKIKRENFSLARPGKTAGTASLTQLVILGLLLVLAILFFISSYGLTVSLEFFLQGLESGLLLLIAILLVASVAWSREDKFRARRKRLAKKLHRQKDILKQRFDAQQNLLSEIKPSLNFAVEEEQKTDYEDYKIIDPKVDQDFQLHINESQLNLAKILVEGENISSFPTEWQQFFVENEGKEPIEKLNSMLKNGDKNRE